MGSRISQIRSNPTRAHFPETQNKRHGKPHPASETHPFLNSFLLSTPHGPLIITEHEEDTASCFIACNNVGALFVHAAAENTSVADILEPNYVPSIVDSFFPLNGVRNYEATSQPLLAVQVTELVDGIFIGCAMSHVVADGKSFWHFINSWAEISRGYNKVSKLPTLDRWFPDSIDRPIRFRFSKEEKQHSVISDPQLPPLRIFHFTKEEIAQLKSKANAEASSDKISSLQALLSHLGRAVVRCQRHIDPHEKVSYCIVIDVRRRMIPALPENYFGNALRGGVATMEAKELLEGGLGKVALEMNKMIALHSDNTTKSHYESWVKTPILFHPDRHVKALATGNCPRFNIYGNDFGWGKPVGARIGCSYKSKRTIMFFSGAEEGSIDIELCHSYDVLEAIGNDHGFIHIF